MSVGALEVDDQIASRVERVTGSDLYIVPGGRVVSGDIHEVPPRSWQGAVVAIPVGPDTVRVEATLPIGGVMDPGVAYHLIKRSLDIVVALLAIVLLLPLILMIAIAIRVNSPGPILFRHRRVGRDGVPFSCLKFRTMVADADTRLKTDATLQAELMLKWKLNRDPRVTSVGRVLRKTSVDELPQLLNVLKGQMSLIGPRPVPRVEFDANYHRHGHLIFSVRPGITGLWQVSGRSSLTYEERIALDLDYVRSRCFWMELRILVMTIPAVLLRRGAV